MRNRSSIISFYRRFPLADHARNVFPVFFIFFVERTLGAGVGIFRADIARFAYSPFSGLGDVDVVGFIRAAYPLDEITFRLEVLNFLLSYLS